MRSQPLFTEQQFVATRHSTAAEKVAFANQFFRFIESGYALSAFSQSFYRRLSMTFGHIAHYDRDGFYATFFTTEEDKLEFLAQTLRYPCYGDPKFTYSDVERAIQAEVRRRLLYEHQQAKVERETRQSEIATLASLQEKYGHAGSVTDAADPSYPASRCHTEQGLLF